MKLNLPRQITPAHPLRPAFARKGLALPCGKFAFVTSIANAISCQPLRVGKLRIAGER